MSDFDQVIRYYAQKCLSILIISNNNSTIDNIIRGMQIKDIYGNTSYSNVDKLNIKKTIFVEKNTIKYTNPYDIDIKEHTVSDLTEYIYDMMVIDNISLTKEQINNYVDTFNSKTNWYILINKNINITSSLHDWKIMNNNRWAELVKDKEQLIIKSDIKNYRSLYILFKNLINILDKNKIVYRLCDYDCLTCYIFNAHSIFTKNIEICVHHVYIDKLIDIINNYSIHRGNGFIIIKKDSLLVKISFYKTSPINESPRKFLFIENPDISFNIDDAGSLPVPRSFGPIKADTFKNPLPYLTKRFGVDFLNKIHYPLLEEKIYDSSILYTDCADFYSQNRSDIWRKELINAGKEVAVLFANAGIKYWLDGGSLLGAVRNGDIPPGDDDIDLGIFTRDLNKIHNLKVPDNIYIDAKANNGCVIRKKKYGILYDIEILAYFKNSNNKYQCNRYSDTKLMKNRAVKCAVPCEYYDKLETIVLGNYIFTCPYNSYKYVELPERYGLGAIDFDPQPHKKSGNQEWKSAWGGVPSIRF